MSSAHVFLVSFLGVAVWLTGYRLPFAASARRRRAGLWLGARFRVSADRAFAVFATLLYTCLGLIVFVVILSQSSITEQALVGGPSLVAAAVTLLAILGTSSLNTLWVSILYRIRSDVNVPSEIASIQWISSAMSIPTRARWLIPALGALVEELVFRGGVFLGLRLSGASFLVAALVSSGMFCLGQVVLVSTAVQSYVMVSASFTLGMVGCLLVASTGSLIPAVVLHTSFAAYYTNMSTAARKQPAESKGHSW